MTIARLRPDAQPNAVISNLREVANWFRDAHVLRLGPWVVCRWCVDRARTADRRIKYGHHQLRNIR